MKTVFTCLLYGALLTLATLLVETDGCVCGNDKGLPLPVVRPICGGGEYCIPLDKKPKCKQTVFDIKALMIDYILWVFVVYGATRLVLRMKRRFPIASIDLSPQSSEKASLSQKCNATSKDE